MKITSSIQILFHFPFFLSCQCTFAVLTLLSPKRQDSIPWGRDRQEGTPAPSPSIPCFYGHWYDHTHVPHLPPTIITILDTQGISVG